jgi:predicted dehydrogenase
MIENEDDLKPLGVGILGAANIAKKTIRALSMTPHFHVVAIGSRSKQKAQELLDASPNTTSASTSLCSYDEVLASQDVDIVYIPLPSALHLEWVEKAANAGKHILLEKPIATSAEEASAMVEACARNNVQLMDGTMWMHHKRADLMMEMLQSGKLGDVKDVTAIFSFTAPADFHTNVRFQAECDPLGALGDLGW